MIIGIIHKGSGLGDQLFSYIATRVRAVDLDVDFGFVGQEFFKGSSFMNLNWGEKVEMPYTLEEPSGRIVPQSEFPVHILNKPYYDPEFNFIEDGTVIDGYGAQDIRYFEHRLDEIKDWLSVEPLEKPNDVCVINFRGGEFSFFNELFLTQEYWDQAINDMRIKYGGITFEVHTDDPETAKKFLPRYPIIRDIETNWRCILGAKHLIISNSAFAIIPALLNKEVKEVIAPHYWARRNTKEWSLPSNYYKKFKYI